MPPKSKVWQNYVLEDKIARCKRFSKTIQLCGSTTNAWANLRSQHGISPSTLAPPESFVLDDKDNPDDPAEVQNSQPNPSNDTSSTEPKALPVS